MTSSVVFAMFILCWYFLSLFVAHSALKNVSCPTQRLADLHDAHTKRMDLAKFEASAARFKAHTLELRAKRHTVLPYTEKPKPRELVHAETKRGVPVAENRCRAKTLEGRQCGFKATCGEFCKKHAIKT